MSNVYSNSDERIFFLSDDIDEASTGKICNDILCLIAKDDKEEREKKEYTREPIKLYINSFGGGIYSMWALIDTIMNSKTPVYTYCLGKAMSAGFKIFLAGHKRFIYPHSTLMYHQVNCFRSGKYQDLVEDREEMDWIQQEIENYVIERTNLTRETLKSIREKKQDVYYHAQDIINLGMADEIIERK